MDLVTRFSLRLSQGGGNHKLLNRVFGIRDPDNLDMACMLSYGDTGWGTLKIEHLIASESESAPTKLVLF